MWGGRHYRQLSQLVAERGAIGANSSRHCSTFPMGNTLCLQPLLVSASAGHHAASTTACLPLPPACTVGQTAARPRDCTGSGGAKRAHACTAGRSHAAACHEGPISKKEERCMHRPPTTARPARAAPRPARAGRPGLAVRTVARESAATSPRGLHTATHRTTANE